MSMKYNNPYFPLYVGDWIKGTRTMTAQEKGVYIELLLEQWESGFIPDDLEILARISPEVKSVWGTLVGKFPTYEQGRRRNNKLEQVRAFAKKQSENGKKRWNSQNGSQTVANSVAKSQPNLSQNGSQTVATVDIDIDNDFSLNKKEGEKQNEPIVQIVNVAQALDEMYMEQLAMGRAYPGIDLQVERIQFIQKVFDSPDDYAGRDASGLRKAFNYQLRNAKPKTTPNGKKSDSVSQLKQEFASKWGNDGVPPGGK